MKKTLLFAILGTSLLACSTGDSDKPASSSPNKSTDSGSDSGEETIEDSDLPGELSRLEDPVVLTGAQLSSLSGVNATDIVAFARRNDAWQQIPVQVDERLVQDFCEI